MDKKQILGALKIVIFSCECFCNPCEYMRSLSARWESQKSADAESPFLCLTFPCLQHFASRTGTKILAQVVKLPALTLFLPLHYHSHSLFHSSQKVYGCSQQMKYRKVAVKSRKQGHQKLP